MRYWNPEEKELISLGESEIFNKKNIKFLKSNNSKQNVLGRGHIHKDCMIFSLLLEQYLKGRMVDGQSLELSVSLERKGTPCHKIEFGTTQQQIAHKLSKAIRLKYVILSNHYSLSRSCWKIHVVDFYSMEVLLNFTFCNFGVCPDSYFKRQLLALLDCWQRLWPQLLCCTEARFQ